MKITENLKSFSPLEISLLVLFIIYLVLPIQTPDFLAPAINSPLGMLMIFIITVFLFLYMNPILAIVYIFVGYELLRRSSSSIGNMIYNSNVIKHNIYNNGREVVPLFKKENELAEKRRTTLEEEIISTMAPIGHSDPVVYNTSTYKPISESVGSASLF